MRLTVSSSPHLHAATSTSRIMGDVLISLAPSVLAASYFFGLRAFLVVVFCTALCIGLEALSCLVMKRKNTVFDGSAAVTGVLLALTLPADIPLHYTIVGCVTAIVVVKQMFGGLGCNFVNPALTARIVMLVSFPAATVGNAPNLALPDGVTGATPLSGGEVASLLDLFLGRVGGAMGEGCKIAILLGLVYLLVRRVITPVIPLVMVGTVALFSLLVGENVGFQLLSGGLLFAAVFMATDYVTTPITLKGQALYALGCGLITVLIRLYANLPEGVSYAVVLMNIVTPLIDRAFRPRPYGTVKRKRRKKK
ncbi:MAG: RnfABCDGE type electron transport complex subunit D [Ruminococcaceae bacterium]|nr:RnfABCDGE type electron transport complex subunit D [Oscillospiraceae bacterium]